MTIGAGEWEEQIERERGWSRRMRWMRGLTSGHSAWFQRRLGRARIFIDVNNGAGEGEEEVWRGVGGGGH